MLAKDFPPSLLLWTFQLSFAFRLVRLFTYMHLNTQYTHPLTAAATARNTYAVCGALKLLTSL